MDIVDRVASPPSHERIKPNQFYSAQKAPANLNAIRSRIDAFVAKHEQIAGRRIVLVT
ncbi:UNVERIFIED_CONTAM: hypothetical protein HDU68_009892, partial [Siphonaria sp. JEL0065]